MSGIVQGIMNFIQSAFANFSDNFNRTTSGELGTSSSGGVWKSLRGVWFANGKAAKSTDLANTYPAANVEMTSASTTSSITVGAPQVISTTGTVGSISVGDGTTGTVGFFTAVITGMSSTTGLTAGSSLSATNGTGSLFGGSPSDVEVMSVDSSTQITYRVKGGTQPTAGTVTDISSRGPDGGAGVAIWVTDSGNWWGITYGRSINTSCNCSTCPTYSCAGFQNAPTGSYCASFTYSSAFAGNGTYSFTSAFACSGVYTYTSANACSGVYTYTSAYACSGTYTNYFAPSCNGTFTNPTGPNTYSSSTGVWCAAGYVSGTSFPCDGYSRYQGNSSCNGWSGGGYSCTGYTFSTYRSGGFRASNYYRINVCNSWSQAAFSCGGGWTAGGFYSVCVAWVANTTYFCPSGTNYYTTYSVASWKFLGATCNYSNYAAGLCNNQLYYTNPCTFQTYYTNPCTFQNYFTNPQGVSNYFSGPNCTGGSFTGFAPFCQLPVYGYTACNCQTCYPGYIRLIQSSSNVVSEVTRWSLASMAAAFKVVTNAATKVITIRPYKETAMTNQIGSDITYTATSATIAPKFGIVLGPSDHVQGSQLDNLDITSN